METHINQAALKDFRRQFRGKIILPGDRDYNDARKVFNAMIDKHPAVIAQCSDVDDVVRAVHFGRHQELEIAIRGGGHGVAGKGLSHGGLVIDLRQMNAVKVDPAARILTIQGGATMSHMDRATEPYGLAAAGGRVSTTGVGGYILGGGDGWMARYLGLACDNLLEITLVTATGEVVQASDTQNPDLFWALHGGGGNFGVATSFTMRLHPFPMATAFILLWPPQIGAQVLSAYRDFMATAPDKLGGGALFLTAMEEDFVPDYLRGNLAFGLFMFYAGPLKEAREIVNPLLAMGHEGEMIQQMSHADMQCLLDDPPGYRNYWTVEYLKEFPDEAVRKFCDRAPQMIVPSAMQHIILPQGGAIARGPAHFPITWRHAPWGVHPYALWQNPEDDQRAIQWTRDIRQDLKPWASGDVYLNFIGDEGADRMVAGFGKENYQKLAMVKAKFDPDNIFRLNHNIKPG